MRATKMKTISNTRLLLVPIVAAFLLMSTAAYAAAPGITGLSFNLTAQPAYLNQPDGAQVYAWGYGCNAAPSAFAPSTISGATCPSMQVPGPTLIVNEGQTVTVTLSNGLPSAAGNTSILFPGFNVTTTGGVPGLMTQEARTSGSVTYSFTASTPGTHAYYSGTQGDLQVEMGLYGAVVVLPSTNPAACTAGLPLTNPGNNAAAKTAWGEADFRLAAAAYDSPKSCYDREYLFQWGGRDPRIHNAALAQITYLTSCTAGSPGCSGTLSVPTEPYHPAYFLINGRSMPDLDR